MRDKIDNLILINLLWFVVSNSGSLIHFLPLYMAAIVGALLSLIYEVSIIRQIQKKVEEQHQARMMKRVNYNIFFTVIFVMFSILNYVF